MSQHTNTSTSTMIVPATPTYTTDTSTNSSNTDLFSHPCHTASTDPTSNIPSSLYTYSTSTESSFSAPPPSSLVTPTPSLITPPTATNPYALGGWGREWEQNFMSRISKPVSLDEFPAPPKRESEMSVESDVWEYDDVEADEARTITAKTVGSSRSGWSGDWSEVSLAAYLWMREMDHG